MIELEIRDEQLDRLWRVICRDLAKAKAGFEEALQPDSSNRFEWLGKELWVNRERRLILHWHQVPDMRRETIDQPGLRIDPVDGVR